MTVSLAYPLEQIIKVKQNRVEEQEKVVRARQEALEKEKQKLKEKEEIRDKAKQHERDKLQQLRDEMDHGTTSDKIQQMKAYLNVAKEKVQIEEKKVKDQQDQVELANKALKAAQDELKIKRQEVDKLQIHKKDWLKEMQKELEVIEAREQDELGSTSFLSHKRMRERK
ncbi:MAG: type III secretion T3S chaperone [Parachlamydiaceae bacterium]|nr:type III secretion T3S chaperone [Parachlamydiaceae bacterium]